MLVRRTLTDDGSVRDDVASLLMELQSRSQLKAFLAALRREIKRRTVFVKVAGDPAPAQRTVAERFPGRAVDVAPDASLGAGVRVSAGDDIVDASVHGTIQRIIAELGST